ncbi:MAG: hypothetical protein WBA93_16120 [Microcoleaceae cyanobacterium]
MKFTKIIRTYIKSGSIGIKSFKGRSQVGEPSDWRGTGVRRKNSYKDLGMVKMDNIFIPKPVGVIHELPLLLHRYL